MGTRTKRNLKGVFGMSFENHEISFWISALLLLGIVVFLGSYFLFSPLSGNGLYAVYLQSGDLYFGKLERFPTFGLRQVYLLRLNGTEENPVGIQRFDQAFWGPGDFLAISKDQVVWIAELRDDSDVNRLIAQNPELLAPQAVLGQPENVEIPEE